MAKAVIKDPGSFTFLFCHLLMVTKWLLLLQYLISLWQLSKAERTWMGEGDSNLLRHFSFFRKKNICEKSPDQDPR